MSDKPTVCLICGKLGTGVWTITNGPRVAIADLCSDHAGPLENIMARAEARPRNRKATVNRVQRIDRTAGFQPLDWEPPS